MTRDEAREPCQWCEIDGRCIDGIIVWWDQNGRHEAPCHCWCHREVSHDTR